MKVFIHTTSVARVCVILFLFAFSFSFASTTHAQTIISDTIADGSVWTPAQGPYVIEGAVELPINTILTIEPGTVVKFDEYASIESHGSISAIGTADNPIVLTSLKDDSTEGDTNGDGSATTPVAYDWNGINFYGHGTGTFDYNTLRYGSIYDGSASTKVDIDHLSSDYSELFSDGGPLTVKNSSILHASGAAVEAGNSATVTIDATTIDSTDGSGVDASGATVIISNSTVKNTAPSQFNDALSLKSHATATIANSIFDGGTNGIHGWGTNTLTVTNSKIKNFSNIGLFDGPGIYLFGVVQNATLEQTTPADISVTTTEIADNGTGIFLNGDSTIDIHDNSIHDNTTGADGANGGDLTNNWWGDPSGPRATDNPDGLGDEVTDGTSYRPWLGSDPLATVTCCSSVAFIPGIEGSRLYSNVSGTEKQLWEPHNNADVRGLSMTDAGASVDPTIYTKDVIDTTNSSSIISYQIYGKFIDSMNDLKSQNVIADWEALPYDWRYSVTDVVENGVQFPNASVLDLESEIESLAANSHTGKVTIIAHSNGGLVTKALMEKLAADNKEDLVDKIIFVAVPQLGTPDAVKVLLHGMNLGPFGVVMNRSTARAFAENTPGAYGLLPSKKYFDTVTDPVVSFDPSVDDVNNFTTTYGTSISSKDGLDDFLLGKDGRAKPTTDDVGDPNVLNKNLLDDASVIHDSLDNWQPPDGIELFQIAGWGVDTLKNIKYIAKYPCTALIIVGTCKPYLDEKPITTEEGDGTVVYPSAISSNATNYYFNIDKYNEEKREKINHQDILISSSILSLIDNVIKDVDGPVEWITTNKPSPEDGGKRIHVSIHSPASIDLYDVNGNHTGPVDNPDGDIGLYEENIPNSYYMEFGEGKYAGFSADAGNMIRIQGTGAGTFTLNIDTVDGDTVTETQTFPDIPVTPDTKAQVVLPQTGQTQLALDTDGDGATDFTIQPTEADDEIDPILFLQIMKKTIISLDLPEKIEKRLLQKIDKVIKLVTKDKKKKVVALIKQFSMNIHEKKWIRSRKLTDEQRASLVEIIGNLLDNIK
ncbi:MAG TPA: right-handed parallel beta-helix repeat-containing protein [Candidatus Paceibacterota bacterium]|nr:right-handed parallel beta-helix repeat-containing protein [Candidatus Paceibacterota bacterium]